LTSSSSKTLFLTLRVFSATGGIERVCRVLGKALYEQALDDKGQVEICSMYDKQKDAFNNHYFPTENFRGFGIRKVRFMLKAVRLGCKSDIVLVSHINLLAAGYLVKKLSPRTKVFMLAHGIEVWSPLSWRKQKMLHSCDAIISVSSFTSETISKVQGVGKEKCAVLNNCLDPFLPPPSFAGKKERLLKRYGFSATDTILMTLTRCSSKERYKGYDKVIEAMSSTRLKNKAIKYLIAGKCDAAEKRYLQKLVREAGLVGAVIMPGYIPGEEVEEHFAMADIYIMPSRGEGFGIVFIEAMYYGLPVIAGNADGSADALQQGRLGQLVDPMDAEAIAEAISRVCANKSAFIPDRKLLLQHFSYETYKENLHSILGHYSP
jgi:phosphatidyl-myo-inositol dimannoside synthase